MWTTISDLVFFNFFYCPGDYNWYFNAVIWVIDQEWRDEFDQTLQERKENVKSPVKS